jgi:hypothetical protein
VPLKSKRSLSMYGRPQPGHGTPGAILIERQRCDIAPHRITQTLTIVLSTHVFRRHLEGLGEVTEPLVGIKVN